MRKRIQKISIFLGISFIILLCGALVFVQSETFLNWVEKRLETELKNRLTDDYTISVEDIEGSIFGNITVKNVKIAEISEADEPIISTRRVVLKYNLLQLLSRKFEVTELTVNDPEIRAKSDLDGQLNLSKIFQEPPSSEDAPQFSFAVEKVRLKEGKIDYTDPQRDLEISVQGITINVDGPLDTWNHKGDLKIDAGSFAFNGAETPIDMFEADFQISTTHSQLRRLQLEFGNSHLDVTGHFPSGETGAPWEIALSIQKLDVADIDQFFGEDIELEGSVKGRMTAFGTDSDLTVALTAEMPTFSITHQPSAISSQPETFDQTSPSLLMVSESREPRAILLTDLIIDAALNLQPIPTFTLKTFNAQIADGTLTGNGSIGHHNRPTGTLIAQLQQLITHPTAYSGQLAATDIQLMPLLSMFVQLPDFLADSTGHLSGNATFHGSSRELSSLGLTSTLEITDTVLNTVALKDSALNCKIEDGVLNTDGYLDETVIAVTGPFPLTEQDLLDIRISDINFDDLMKIVNSVDFGGTGKYTAQLTSDGKLNGYIEIPNADFFDIPIGVLTGNLNYYDGQVFVENGQITKNTINDAVTEEMSQVSITGVVDVEGEFPAQFSVIANPVYVQHYPKLLLGAEYPVTAEIRGELTLDGTLINLDGSADFSVTEGIAWGIHLDPVTLPLRIEDYALTLSDFKVTTRGQSVTLNVAVAPNADFDFRLESDAPVNFQELSKAAQISDFPFDGQLDVSVVGIFKKPEPLDFQIELDFADITYLDFEDNGHVERFPLGDAVLHGELVELNSESRTSSRNEGAADNEERTDGKGDPPDKPQGKLKKSDRFDFTGHGFSGQIQGYVSMALDNPYKFTVETIGLEVRPILRILHPAFETVTGTVDGRAQIEGTVTDLVGTAEDTSPNSEEQRIFPYKVDVEVDTSQLQYSEPTGQTIPFTNAEQIQIRLRDDIWTIDTLSCRTLADTLPFIELTGTFDAKSNTMDMHASADGFALSAFAPAVGLLPEDITAGSSRYTAEIEGTSEHPIVVADWIIPKLDLKTENGVIYITEASGTIDYRNDTVHFEKTTLKLLGNAVDIAGDINVDLEDLNNSQLHLTANASTLEVTTFAELIARVSENAVKSTDLTSGVLDTSIDITGTVTETSIAVRAQTAPQQPIHLAPYANPITVTNLNANATLRSDFIHIESIKMSGQIGSSTYAVQGDATFSTQNAEKMQFRIDMSASELEVSDFLTLLSDETSPAPLTRGDKGGLHGTVSGQVKLNGTGTDLHQISITGRIAELNLHGYDTDFTNRSEIEFQSERGDLTVRLPLELKSSNSRQSAVSSQIESITSPETSLLMVSESRKPIAIRTDIYITGTFEAPEIIADWSGNISEMESNGSVEYRNEQITVKSIELKNRSGTSTLTGFIPFNLAFTAIDISDRFTEQPMDLRLRGYELPLEFFPGVGKLFSESDGTVDIDLTVQGTSRNPHIIGEMSLEALKLRLKNFHAPIQNMKVKLIASENIINFKELQFEMDPGYCTLQQGQLVLDGLMPKELTLKGLRFERFPLGSTVQHAIPLDVLEDVEGHVSATLTGLRIPFDRFLSKVAGTPLPQISHQPSAVSLNQELAPIFKYRKSSSWLKPETFDQTNPSLLMVSESRRFPKAISLTDIMEVSSADLSINSVRLAFTVMAWDRHYDFQDPRPVQVSLNAGTLTLPEPFILKNQHAFSVKQTFTSEDEKPEDIRGDVHTIEDAQTTLTVDSGNLWSVNGEFDTALRFKNFDVSAITHTWDAPYRVNGALSGSLQMKGTSENPKITFRRHESEPAELYLDDIPIDLRWRVRYQDGKWEISKKRFAHISFGRNDLRFSGILPYRIELIPFLMQLQRAPDSVWQKFQETDINGTLDLNIEYLDILQSMVPDLTSPTGTSSVRVEFTGTVETPKALGAVTFNNIGFSLPTAGMYVEELEGRIVLTEQGATVENLNGRLNGGTFAITGSVKTPADGRVWENPPTLDVQASISSTTFEQSRKYQIKLADNPSQFYLQGGFDDPKLTGNLNISGGYYEQNWETVLDWLVGASVSEIDVMLDYPILKNLELEVDIDIADNFEVLSSIAGPINIKISCAGKLVGLIQEPIYNGNISVLSGIVASHLIPQAFEFIEDSGSNITNRSLDTFNPELNLSLRTPKRIRGVLPRDGSTVDLQIVAKLTGTLNSPDFTLSTPDATEVLTHEDIWAFLVRNISFSHALGPFTFNFHRPNDADARSISAEYQLRENMSIKIESNENGEYGADFEIKGRF